MLRKDLPSVFPIGLRVMGEVLPTPKAPQPLPSQYPILLFLTIIVKLKLHKTSGQILCNVHYLDTQCHISGI